MARTEPMPRAERHFIRIVGLNLRMQREAIGATQAGVAEWAKVSRSYLAELERGRVNISILTLWRISVVLVRPLGDMFAAYDW